LDRVLVPAPRVVGIKEPPVVPEFLAALHGIGLEAVRVDAYVTRPTADPRATAEPLALLLNGEIDVVALTSVGEADALVSLVGGAEALDALLLRLDKAGNPNRVVLACFGPVTANGVERLGLKPTLHATQFGRFAGFVQALDDHFA